MPELILFQYKTHMPVNGVIVLIISLLFYNAKNNAYWSMLNLWFVMNYILRIILWCSFQNRCWHQSPHGGASVTYSLRWRHNGHDSVPNHQPHDCLLNCLFRRRSKKASKLRVTGLCAGNSPETGEFPAQMASYAEHVSIWWRHHVAILLHMIKELIHGYVVSKLMLQPFSDHGELHRS